MDRTGVNGGSYPLQANHCRIYLFSSSRHAPRTLFPNENSSPQTKPSLYSDHCAIILYLITMSELFPDPTNCLSRVRMSEALSVAEKVVEEVLIDLMTERVMSERGLSTGVQASSTRGLQASPSTARAGPSRPADEKRTKHRDDIVNAKLILSILPAYLPPLSGTINRDSVPHKFEYALITAYLPKEVRAVRADQDKLTALKFSDFNLGDRKVYSMLAPHKYLT
jgi:hypothetical protein